MYSFETLDVPSFLFLSIATQGVSFAQFCIHFSASYSCLSSLKTTDIRLSFTSQVTHLKSETEWGLVSSSCSLPLKKTRFTRHKRVCLVCISFQEQEIETRRQEKVWQQQRVTKKSTLQFPFNLRWRGVVCQEKKHREDQEKKKRQKVQRRRWHQRHRPPSSSTNSSSEYHEDDDGRQFHLQFFFLGPSSSSSSASRSNFNC